MQIYCLVVTSSWVTLDAEFLRKKIWPNLMFMSFFQSWRSVVNVWFTWFLVCILFVSFVLSNFQPLYFCWFSFLTSTSVTLITTWWNSLVSNPDCTGLKPPLHLGPQFIFYFFGSFNTLSISIKSLYSIYILINLLDWVRILEYWSPTWWLKKNIEHITGWFMFYFFILSFLILFVSKT